jgi:hypothetical protein
MTNDEHAERVARIHAERVAAGRAPTIQSEALYRLLSACIDANDRKSAAVNK